MHGKLPHNLREKLGDIEQKQRWLNLATSREKQEVQLWPLKNKQLVKSDSRIQF